MVYRWIAGLVDYLAEICGYSANAQSRSDQPINQTLLRSVRGYVEGGAKGAGWVANCGRLACRTVLHVAKQLNRKADFLTSALEQN
jgi:hypothetical protein